MFLLLANRNTATQSCLFIFTKLNMNVRVAVIISKKRHSIMKAKINYSYVVSKHSIGNSRKQAQSPMRDLDKYWFLFSRIYNTKINKKLLRITFLLPFIRKHTFKFTSICELAKNMVQKNIFI